MFWWTFGHTRIGVESRASLMSAKGEERESCNCSEKLLHFIDENKNSFVSFKIVYTPFAFLIPPTTASCGGTKSFISNRFSVGEGSSVLRQRDRLSVPMHAITFIYYSKHSFYFTHVQAVKKKIANILIGMRSLRCGRFEGNVVYIRKH